MSKWKSIRGGVPKWCDILIYTCGHGMYVGHYVDTIIPHVPRYAPCDYCPQIPETPGFGTQHGAGYVGISDVLYWRYLPKSPWDNPDKWTDASVKAPESDTRVLAYDDAFLEIVDAFIREDGTWFYYMPDCKYNFEVRGHISHWRPYPKPPQEEINND